MRLLVLLAVPVLTPLFVHGHPAGFYSAEQNVLFFFARNLNLLPGVPRVERAFAGSALQTLEPTVQGATAG